MRAFRFRGFTRCVLFCGIVSIATMAHANSGEQVPLSQIQAGTVPVTPNLIQNPGFENLTAGNPNNWLKGDAGTDNMQVGAPINPPPNDLSVVGNSAAQALTNQLTATDPENYHYSTDNSTQATITFDQHTEYELSAYMWNFGRPDPEPGLDQPDLALVELDPVGSGGKLVNVALARNGEDGGDAINGYYFTQDFPGSDFPNGATLDVRGDLDDLDSAPLNPPNNIYAQFDNIGVAVIPEPASLAFLGIAAVLGLATKITS